MTLNLKQVIVHVKPILIVSLTVYLIINHLFNNKSSNDIKIENFEVFQVIGK